MRLLLFIILFSVSVFNTLKAQDGQHIGTLKAYEISNIKGCKVYLPHGINGNTVRSYWEKAPDSEECKNGYYSSGNDMAFLEFFNKYGNEIGAYTGGIKEGKFDGNGTYMFFDIKYKGFFREGQIVKGTLSSVFGKHNETYEGEFENYVKHGYGVYDKGNSRYEGYFYNDKENGEGMIILEDGTEMEIISEHGELKKFVKSDYTTESTPKFQILSGKELYDAGKIRIDFSMSSSNILVKDYGLISPNVCAKDYKVIYELGYNLGIKVEKDDPYFDSISPSESDYPVKVSLFFKSDKCDSQEGFKEFKVILNKPANWEIRIE